MVYRASDEMNAEIVAMYQELKNGNEVAKRLRINSSTVYAVLAHCGVDTRKARSEHLQRFTGAVLDRLIAEYQEGVPTIELAKKYSCSRNTILDSLKRAAGVIIREAKPHMTEAEIENARTMYTSGMTLKKVAEKTGRSQATITSLMNIRFPDLVRSKMVGPSGPHWGGGKYIHHSGYVYIWIADDDPMVSMRGKGLHVLEHRLVMARKLGRPLKPNETVHHINGDKTDNRPENLQLRHGKHGKHSAMVCADCGSHNIKHVGLDA